MKNPNTLEINFKYYSFSGLLGTYCFNSGEVVPFTYRFSSIVFFHRNSEKEAIPVYLLSLYNKKVLPNFKFAVKQSKIIRKKSLKSDDGVFFYQNKNHYGEYELWIEDKLINLIPVGLIKKKESLKSKPSLRSLNYTLVYTYESDIGPLEDTLTYDYLVYYNIFEEYKNRLKEFHHSDTTYESMEEIDKHIELLGQLKVDIANAMHKWKEDSASDLFNWLKGKGVLKRDIYTMQ